MKLYEIVIQHKPEVANAFLRGLVAGRNRNEQFYSCAECNISAGHLKKHIADRLGLHGKYSNYVVEDSLLDPVTEAMKEHGAQLHIHLHEVHEVKGLRFDFEMKVFNKVVAQRAKRIIEQRDNDIQLRDYEPKEIVHEESEGAELYAPEHGYELRGQGVAEGPFHEMMDFYAQLDPIDQVECSKMGLLIAENT